VISAEVAPKGVDDASLYRRLAALGLTGLKCFPQIVSVVPGSERIERYQQRILTALTPAEAALWHSRRGSGVRRHLTSSPSATTAPSQPSPGNQMIASR
jgi:hypothetical protein